MSIFVFHNPVPNRCCMQQGHASINHQDSTGPPGRSAGPPVRSGPAVWYAGPPVRAAGPMRQATGPIQVAGPVRAAFQFARPPFLSRPPVRSGLPVRCAGPLVRYASSVAGSILLRQRQPWSRGWPGTQQCKKDRGRREQRVRRCWRGASHGCAGAEAAGRRGLGGGEE